MQAQNVRVVQILLLHLLVASANFQELDFVPTARRGQFHGSRTVWHDLLGRHCPRFAQDTKVAIPIPQPKGYKAVQQNYKIQLVFDGDRIYTPWVQIIGRNSPAAPILHIELEHSGNVLESARAEIRPLSSQYLREHQSLMMEFQNATHWPKHLLVHYTWKHTNPVNATGGLYLVFLLGIVITSILGLQVIVSYQDKLKAFLADLSAEEPALSGNHAQGLAGSSTAGIAVPHKAD